MYIKHYWVSYPGMDRFLIDNNEVPKTHPSIKGLDVKYWLTDDNGVDYCLSICDDDAVLPGGSGVQQLTEEEWNTVVENIISTQKENMSNSEITQQQLDTMTEFEKSLINQ